jgi:thiol reductant ABC exporter CydC subunit
LAKASALGAGAIAASIALLGTSAWLISRAAEHPPEGALALAIVGVQFFGLSRGFLRYGERLVGHDAAFRLLAHLRRRVFDDLERLAPAGLPEFRRGDLLARFVDDIESLQDVVLRVIPPFAVAVVVGAGTVGFIWWVLPGAGAVLLVALVLSACLVPWLTGWLAARREQHQATARGAMAADVVDLVEGAAELIVLGGVGAQLDRVARADGALRAIAKKGANTAGVGLGLTTLLAGLACWGGLALGVPATSNGRIDGALLAVLALVPLAAFELVAPLPAATQALERSRRATARVLALEDAPLPAPDPADPAVLQADHHAVELSSVWAGYPGIDQPALRGVDLDLGPGRRVALVGPSGSGKTTLAEVLVRFLAVRAGTAALDGVSLEGYRGDDVRRVVGLMSQDPHLFNTTLSENLRLGRRSASEDQLRDAMARVGLGEWLSSLPDGLGTQLGPFGHRVSGGQRQRIALARTLLADFSILVVDEPAEHLEPVAADALTADLLTLTAGRSTLLITHRLAGLEETDEVIVLDRGQVVERGTHRSLLSAGGRYAGLWWEERLGDQDTDPSSNTRTFTAGRDIPP